MRIPFTKMQGAGNDFVVLDETRASYHLRPEHYRFLGDRRYGVGADQILTVRPATQPGVDFAYVIHNADGGEVEQCGNGARCFVRFVQEQGMTDKARIRVQVQHGVIELEALPDGTVTVDMGAPRVDHAALPFVPGNLAHRTVGQAELWRLPVSAGGQTDTVEVALVSMGNADAGLPVDDVMDAPVEAVGRAVQALPAFPSSVNVGFLQVLDRGHVRLRVYERGAGETLACGTGACAAVVAGIRQGLLDPSVQVDALGGTLRIDWQGAESPVLMSGPATTVYHGEIDLPEHPWLPEVSKVAA